METKLTTGGLPVPAAHSHAVMPGSGVAASAAATSAATARGNVWFMSWLFLNVGVTLLNKSVFSFNAFNFPLTLSATHMFACGVLSWVCVRQLQWFPENKDAMKGEGATRIYLFSILFTLNIVMGNLGIQEVSVALGQVIRALIPGITMGLSYVLLGQKPTMWLGLSLVPICLGIVFTVQGDVEVTMLGLFYTIFGSFLSALKVVLCNKFLVGSYKMDPVDLLMRISPLAFVQIMILVYFYEFEELYARWDDFTQDSGYVWSMVWTTALMAFLLNITNFYANQYTSPLTLTVGGNVKQVITIVLSIAIFSTQVTWLSSVGMVVCTCGAAMYSMVKYYKL
eukprot:TRINITY_DN2818_c2_g1_i2.p1 TRINITY_DN2818_c2_g1~~TRINITY_DN2818_c2_g1_i2.p1  ORF type:complete len:339 (-),score=39.30 TRINITY_DN2818_c2_g1_i2:3-1019(-)